MQCATHPRSQKKTLLRAVDWAEMQPIDEEGELAYKDHSTHLALCRVFVAQNRPAPALRLLERLLMAAEQSGRNLEVVEILVIKALALQAFYQPNEALATLVHCLILAEPEGYIRTFVDEGYALAQLLFSLSQRPSAVNRVYLDTLLAAFADAGLAHSPQEAAAPLLQHTAPPTNFDKPGFEAEPATMSPIAPPPLGMSPEPHKRTPSKFDLLIEPLSKRELEILYLVAQGLTNAEIAQQIFISAQTVKVHTRNIYGKLGVNSRRQAVAKARAFNLLS